MVLNPAIDWREASIAGAPISPCICRRYPFLLSTSIMLGLKISEIDFSSPIKWTELSGSLLLLTDLWNFWSYQQVFERLAAGQSWDIA